MNYKSTIVVGVASCLIAASALAQSSKNSAIIARATSIMSAPEPPSPLTLPGAQFCAEVARTAKGAGLDLGPMTAKACLLGGTPQQQLNKASMARVVSECAAHVSSGAVDAMAELHACEDGEVAQP